MICFNGIVSKFNKRAFTLAEVLITLGIIGIVAALTLPVLINNINGNKFRAQYKKTFSSLSQVAKIAQERYDYAFDAINEECLSDGSDNPRERRSMCGILNGTLTGATYIGLANYYGKNIKIGDYDISEYYAYLLADGSVVGFYKNIGYCSVPLGTILSSEILTNGGELSDCMGFIDVNYKNKPDEVVQGYMSDNSSWIFGLPAYSYTGSYDAGYGSSESGYGSEDFDVDYCSADIFEPRAICKVNNKAGQIADIYPIVFHDGVVEAASGPAKSVLHTTK